MSDRLYVSTRKGLFVFDRQTSGRWEIASVAFLGDPITMFLDDPHSRMQFATSRLGHFGVKVYRSSDRAQTWEECAAPTYPPQPDEARTEAHAWSLDQVWSLETGGPADPDTLWAGTNPGGLFRSRDRGSSWELNRGLWDHPERKRWSGGGFDIPGIHSICVDPQDGNKIIVGVSVGGVWRTSDGGETWDACSRGMHADYMPPELAEDPTMQDPHRVVQCPSNTDWLWLQHHCGMYVSRDGAHSWETIRNVQPSVFGFAVAVHPTDPQTAWFVPAIKDERRVPVDGRVVVTRTRDGGHSFDVLSDGLPQQHAYDIAYRHALDVAADGTRLAFGSTTGSLWLSDNAGDSWQTLSEHLPPVYAVRFAAG
jgi:photosystem II stability/assembly factor-like uncharacterized protein